MNDESIIITNSETKFGVANYETKFGVANYEFRINHGTRKQWTIES